MGILEVFTSVILAVNMSAKMHFLIEKWGRPSIRTTNPKATRATLRVETSAKNGATRGQQMVTKAQGRVSHCEL